jgi:protease-4
MKRLVALLTLPLRLIALLFRLLERLGLAFLGALALALGVVAVAALLFLWRHAPTAPAPLPAHFVLDVALRGEVEEAPSPFPFADDAIPFGTLVETLAAAADDPRVVGVAIDLTKLGSISYAQIGELRAQIARLRAHGKPVWAYAEHFDQKRYLLASAATEITLDPEGYLLLPGLALEPTYLKAALDRLGVTFYAVRAGRYKSFVEPFTRTGMSADERVAVTDLLLGLWQQITLAIASDRSLPREAVEGYHARFDERLARHGGDPAATALAERLVDRLDPHRRWRERLREVAQLGDGARAFISWRDYAVRRHASAVLATGAATIRVIALTGTIIETDDEAPPGSASAAIAALQEARDDKRVRAVVLRIDSPGGNAFTAEQVRRAVADLRAAGKPVIASLGGVAASGGYWVASASDAIVAQPETVTGSIGVFALIPNAAGLLQNWSLTTEGVRTGPFAAPLDPRQPLPEPVVRALQASVDHTYRRFLHVVSEGRKLPEAEVAAVAEGRVWLGSAAVKLGLVDRLGGLTEAITLARQAANAPEAAIEWHTPLLTPRTLLRRLLLATGLARSISLTLPGGFAQSTALLPPSIAEWLAAVPLTSHSFPLVSWAHCLCSAP